MQQALAKAQPEVLKIGGFDPKYEASLWNAPNTAFTGSGVTVTSATAGSTSYAYNSLVRQ
jgi:hypothetical protein